MEHDQHWKERLERVMRENGYYRLPLPLLAGWIRAMEAPNIGQAIMRLSDVEGLLTPEREVEMVDRDWYRVNGMYWSEEVEIRPGLPTGRVVLLEPFKPQLVALARQLEAYGHRVFALEKLEELIPTAHRERAEVAVVGAMPDEAAPLLIALKAATPGVRIVLAADRLRGGQLANNMEDIVGMEGVTGFLLKPVNPARLVNAVGEAMGRKS